MSKASIVHLQLATSFKGYLPNHQDCQAWVCAVLASEQISSKELTIRIVDADESAQLNETYRHKSKPTNVLSFPTLTCPGSESNYLGDLALCASLIDQESTEQGKTPKAHWAHLIVHGVLHLLGYDHLSDDEAEHMESLEISILQQLGYPDPYHLFIG